MLPVAIGPGGRGYLQLKLICRRKAFRLTAPAPCKSAIDRVPIATNWTDQNNSLNVPR